MCPVYESLVAISGISGSLSANMTPLWTQQALAPVTCRTWPSELQTQPVLLWEVISFVITLTVGCVARATVAHVEVWGSGKYFYLCSPGCPVSHSVNQAGLKLRELPASASQVMLLKTCITIALLKTYFQ